MKKRNMGNSGLLASELGLGCMRMGGLPEAEVARLIDTAMDCGMNLFDHADIYGGGASEQVFGRALRASGQSRESIVIQSKCGIRDGFFDFSREHILASVAGSLQRLGVDYLDVLLLHRPDALMEPEEVAAAFSELHRRGVVRHFGVSNQHPGQIELLKTVVEQPLIINQLQLSLAHTPSIDHGLNVNMNATGAVNRDGGIIEYCRKHQMTIQPWSPLQFGFFQGVFIDHPDYGPLNEVLRRIAAGPGVTPSAVALAWLLRHPAGFQPIIGSTKADRICDLARAAEIPLSRPEWYELYRAAGNTLP